MSSARFALILLVVSFLLCFTASAVVAGPPSHRSFTASDKEVTVDFDFRDPHCKWTIDLWNSGLTQRMYQGQKQVFVKSVDIDGGGSAIGNWWAGGNPPWYIWNEIVYPSAFVASLNVGRFDVYTPRTRLFNGGDGQWIGASLVVMARPDPNAYSGFEASSSNIDIYACEVWSS